MRGQRNLLIFLLALFLTTSSVSGATFDERVTANLRGGKVYTTGLSIWQLNKYKSVDLLRKSPMKWCPYLAYITVDRYVQVTDADNMNWLYINADLIGLLYADATANRQFAQAFQVHGTRKQQVRQIYRFCKATKYVPHVKYASDVFTTRTGDCAGIASAFYVLCKAKHIPVRYVIGWTSNGCHAWNRVKIKGKWYWIDCTHRKWIQRKQYANRTVMEIW